MIFNTSTRKLPASSVVKTTLERSLSGLPKISSIGVAAVISARPTTSGLKSNSSPFRILRSARLGPSKRLTMAQPEQGEQREGLFPAFPVSQRSHPMSNKTAARRPYIRPMQGWWRRDPFFMVYMARRLNRVRRAGVCDRASGGRAAPGARRGGMERLAGSHFHHPNKYTKN